MKKLFFLFMMLISLQVLADKKTPAEKAKEKTDEMQHDLTLTPEQSKKVYDINLKTYASIADYEAKETSVKLRKKQKDIATDIRKAEFKKVLTAPQFKKYDELKKKEKELKKAKEKELDKLKK